MERGKVRPYLIDPGGGDATESVVMDALKLVGIDTDPAYVARWTKYERILAYDFAIREHMVSEGKDDLAPDGVRPRPCPSFVIDARVQPF